MDFSIRNSDARNPFSVSATGDGYFKTQALRAGYLGDYGRPDLVQKQYSETEAQQREIEKKKIREQIIAEELSRKRELEEEVRREMAIERHMALRGPADRLQLLPSFSEPRIVDRVPLPPLHESRVVERLSFPPRPESRLIERMPLPPIPEPRVVEGIIPQRFIDPAPSEQLARLRPFPEIKKRPAQFGTMQVNLTPGWNKRKAEPAGAQGLLFSTTGKKIRIEWSCSLCQVSCTSEKGLSDHLIGKKHKAKEEEVKAKKGGGAAPKNKESVAPVKAATNKPETPQKKTIQKTKVTPKTGEPKPNKSKKIEAGKKKKLVSGDKDQKKFRFWCEHCSIGCHSEVVMTSHCSGKKHKARMEELKNGGGSSSDVGTAGTANAKENGKVEDAEAAGEAQGEEDEENQVQEDGSEDAEQRGEVDQDTVVGDNSE